MQAAGITGMIRRTGYMRLYRNQQMFEQSIAKQTAERDAYGIQFKALDGKGVAELEPHLSETFAGGVFMPEPVSVGDPGAVGRAYAALFVERGGRFVRGEARTLERVQHGWQVATETGLETGRDAVLALGPWSDDLMAKFGAAVPLGVKRGYHMHYRARGNAVLNRPLLDTDNGYVISPMTQGHPPDDGRRVRAPGRAGDARATRQGRTGSASFVSTRTARRRRALDRRAPMPAGYATGDRAGARQSWSVGRFRPSPSRLHDGAGDRSLARRTLDGRDAVHRSDTVPAGSLCLIGTGLHVTLTVRPLYLSPCPVGTASLLSCVIGSGSIC